MRGDSGQAKLSSGTHQRASLAANANPGQCEDGQGDGHVQSLSLRPENRLHAQARLSKAGCFIKLSSHEIVIGLELEIVIGLFLKPKLRK